MVILKRSLFAVAVIPLVGIILQVFGGSVSLGDGDKPVLRVAYSRVIDDLPFFVGVEEGFFEREGIRVELTRLTGATNTLAAVYRDEIQAALMGVSQLFPAAQQKLPIKIVAWLGKTHSKTNCGLHVRNNAPIHGFKDLRGKRIAVSGEISNRMMVLQALALGGMTAADANLLLGFEMGDPMQQEAVLKTGRVDVIIA